VDEDQRSARRRGAVQVGDELPTVGRHGDLLDAHIVEERGEPGLAAWQRQRQRQADGRSPPHEQPEREQGCGESRDRDPGEGTPSGMQTPSLVQLPQFEGVRG